MKLDHSQKRRIIEIAVIVVLSCVLFLACNHNSLNNDIVISNRDDSPNEELSDGTDEVLSDLPEKNASSETEEYEKLSETKALPKKVCVYVCGAVKNPGLYELPEGSRKMDALEAAGGFGEDACTDYINLADYITDGEMLRIPYKEEISSYPLEGGGGNAGTGQSLVNINKASVDELTTIPGIGKSKAEAIVRFRTSGGKFDTPEDLMKIPGIKKGTYEKLKDSICVN